MPKFRKAILEANRTYRSPDGEVFVDAARLKHWCQSFWDMNRAGLSVPISWGHDPDGDRSVPVRLSTPEERKRPPENTVGYLHDVQMAPSGDRATIVIDVPRDEDAEKVEKNLAYVSPVIRDKWLDGDGREWQDIFGHMDLVQWPVDHRQSKFEPVEDEERQAIACALRMSCGDGPVSVYKLSTGEDKMADESTKDEKTEGAEGTENETVESDGGRLKKVIEALGKMQIVLSDDTSEENFLEHLEQALLTVDAMNNGGEGGDVGAAEDLEVATPDFAAMSLEREKERKYVDRQHRQSIGARLDALLETGRCTPFEAKQQRANLPAVRLSLDEDGNAVKGTLEAWLDSREPVPVGTFWDETKRTRMSTLKPEPHPSDFEGEPTEEESEAIVKEVFGDKS